MKKYIPKEVEKSAQAKWRKENKPIDLTDSRKKFYLLVEFTYPSGDLHMGHWFAFAVPDILARYKRMNGFCVFAPNGFDAFGLPAENAAIVRGIHPKDWTFENIKKMKSQFATMGAIYDWGHSVITCEPEYYRWNQWIFLKMLEKGLAYRGKVLSNWCPQDQTVLANENVENGKCWRCGEEVVQKEVEQWFLKITDYAEKLLWKESENSAKSESQKVGQSESQKDKSRSDRSDNLDIRHSESSEYSEIDWPKPVRDAQNNWIGKSEGMEIQFPVDQWVSESVGQRTSSTSESVKKSTDKTDTPNHRTTDTLNHRHTESITVYTVFPETIFGVTFMVLAPEHMLVSKLVTEDRKKEVDEYIKTSQKKSELERISLDKEKTGVFTGSYCVNPVNGQKVPIWIADYVISTYGTGAVMGVPGSDHRDFAFATKYELPIVRVVASVPGDQSEVKTDGDVLEEGYIVNSGQFDNVTTPNPARDKIKDFLQEKGWGKRKVQYHLHDWSISRQRYWGTPIPIIYCDKCGTVPVPEKDLPVELPYDVDFAPKGKPPLATAEDWVRVKCPNCGGDGRREVETMDTFVDSSWYFLRYLRNIPENSAKSESQMIRKSEMPDKSENLNIRHSESSEFSEKLPWDSKLVKEWMPVDIYFGGAEHTLGHTLYSRFFFKFLQEIGVVAQMPEYAAKRVHHGVILGPDGLRMSKSKGNVVNPDEQVKEYGADAVRLYLAFLGPYDLVAPWDPGGLRGVYHFLERVWKMADAVVNSSEIIDHSTKDNTPGVSPGESLHTPGVSTEDLRWLHQSIKKVGDDIEATKFNTAVSTLMTWLNYLSGKVHSSQFTVHSLEKEQSEASVNRQPITVNEYEVFLKLLAPFAPHITEELWQMIKSSQLTVNSSQKKQSEATVNCEPSTVNSSIHDEPWPQYDEAKMKAQKVTIVVQINGRVRGKLLTEAGTSQKEVEKLALDLPRVQNFVGKGAPRKVIYIADRLINFVI